MKHLKTYKLFEDAPFSDTPYEEIFIYLEEYMEKYSDKYNLYIDMDNMHEIDPSKTADIVSIKFNFERIGHPLKDLEKVVNEIKNEINFTITETIEEDKSIIKSNINKIK